MQPDRVNIFIGGAGDQTSNRNVFDSTALRQDIYGYNYYATNDEGDQVTSFIKQLPPDTQITVIGHSWGGDTASKIAIDNPGRISVLVTVDPVSYNNPDFGDVKNSVGSWINVNAIDSPGSDSAAFGNILAFLGHSWDDGPKRYADFFIAAPYDHSQFNAMMTYKFSNSATIESVLNQSR